MQATSEKINVAVRVKPLGLGEHEAATVAFPEYEQIRVKQNKAFTFDHVFGENGTQAEIYSAVVENLISGVISGFNATVLAYGQTGSGKTFTMGTDCATSHESDLAGVIPRSLCQLFSQVEALQQNSDSRSNVQLSIQFLELYNEDLRDLLIGPSNSSVRPHLIRLADDPQSGSIRLIGAIRREVANIDEALLCLKEGSKCRATAATGMNAQSSRSHAIFTVFVRQECERADGATLVKESKLHLVDLAGSERAHRTGATGERAREGININYGLLALGNVITALAERRRPLGTVNGVSFPPRYIPYRDSKLTRLLSDSLGGNSRTVMIACVSAAEADVAETLTTLKYADRVKSISNKVVHSAVIQERFAVPQPPLPPPSLPVPDPSPTLFPPRRTRVSPFRKSTSELEEHTKRLHALYASVQRERETFHKSSSAYDFGLLFHHIRQCEMATLSTGHSSHTTPHVHRELAARENWLKESRLQLLLSSSAVHRKETEARNFATQKRSAFQHAPTDKALWEARGKICELELEVERLEHSNATRDCLLQRAMEQLQRHSQLLREVMNMSQDPAVVKRVHDELATLPEEQSQIRGQTLVPLSPFRQATMGSFARCNTVDATFKQYRHDALCLVGDGPTKTVRSLTTTPVENVVVVPPCPKPIPGSSPDCSPSTGTENLNSSQRRRRRTHVLKDPILLKLSSTQTETEPPAIPVYMSENVPCTGSRKRPGSPHLENVDTKKSNFGMECNPFSVISNRVTSNATLPRRPMGVQAKLQPCNSGNSTFLLPKPKSSVLQFTR